MQHRHLVEGVGYTLAAIDDILDRGQLADWAELGLAVRYDRELARRVLSIARATQRYGSTPFWEAFVARFHPDVV